MKEEKVEYIKKGEGYHHYLISRAQSMGIKMFLIKLNEKLDGEVAVFNIVTNDKDKNSIFKNYNEVYLLKDFLENITSFNADFYKVYIEKGNFRIKCFFPDETYTMELRAPKEGKMIETLARSSYFGFVINRNKVCKYSISLVTHMESELAMI